uniref:Uncharacterized protein n=1 Tax=Romanomermis culicivorax TaxID=13658 RepID=A0A915KXZ0_ROMCU
MMIIVKMQKLTNMHNCLRNGQDTNSYVHMKKIVIGTAIRRTIIRPDRLLGDRKMTKCYRRRRILLKEIKADAAKIRIMTKLPPGHLHWPVVTLQYEPCLQSQTLVHSWPL